MFKKGTLGLLMAAAVGLSTQANATPIAMGQIIDGTTFGSNDAFQFFNASDAGEKIVSLTWDLTPIAAFFDSTNSSPGVSSSPLTLGSGDAVGHHFPTNAALDGTSTLTVTFDHFDAGEMFSFGVDTDFFSNPDGFGLTGAQFIGATATAIFSNGMARTGTYVASDKSGYGSMVFIDIPTSVPEPGSLAILGLGLIGLGFARRQAKKA
ncbi:PEP-CTERM sorting domain-containing protein [Simiduia sp. 21SJ11W-1]|uniref:PEP-CTERM sorting domain-containing protein n=1 Tax=Simiduia sp. 21SJ11W-1 TaxID=2909669 RepID=UPI00209F0DF8|nr:PEP-CTERM sorting domain-containing protein [Simiduia sp. 21SJ11W-1]UTA47248.1 PEP-CTERM sorting domain-containing protein [Simiduia sp. 21SJ11W-1]